MKSYNTR